MSGIRRLGVICAGDFNVGDSALLKKHRLSPSGIPCFKATADPKSSSALKSIKSPTSNTAIPRILEEEKHALCEKLAAIDKQAQALESTFLNCGQEIQKMDSRENVDCHADKSAHNDNKNAICEKVDSSKQAHFLSSRALRQQSVAIHTHNAQDTSLESTFDNPNAKTQKVDSRKNARKNAQSIESSNAKKIQPSSKAHA